MARSMIMLVILLVGSASYAVTPLSSLPISASAHIIIDAAKTNPITLPTPGNRRLRDEVRGATASSPLKVGDLLSHASLITYWPEGAICTDKSMPSTFAICNSTWVCAGTVSSNDWFESQRSETSLSVKLSPENT
jgi:hypothetical protein